MNTMSQLYSSITHRILAMKFAGEFMLIYPVYIIMFGDRGVSAAGIGVILATGFVLSVVLEIPTGVLADRIPRKYVLLLAIAAKTMALVSALTIQSFVGFMIAAVFFALSSALESGALQAYLYGTLGKDNKERFGTFWARVSAMIMVSYTLAYGLATIIGAQYSLLLGLSIASCVIAIGLCISLPLDKLAIEGDLKPQIFKSALQHIRATPELVQLLASAIIALAMAEMMIEYLPLYYSQIGIETRFVPLFMGAGNILGAVGFWTLHKWEHVLNARKIVFLLLASVVFAVSFFGGIAFAALGVMLFTRFLRILQVQFESSIQHLTHDKTRATVSSIGSFSAKLLAAGVVLLIGIVSVGNNILHPLRVALLIGAALFCGVYVFLQRRSRAANA